MILIDQVKILDGKIKANKAQYVLDREAAKISALSSGDVENFFWTWKNLQKLFAVPFELKETTPCSFNDFLDCFHF